MIRRTALGLSALALLYPGVIRGAEPRPTPPSLTEIGAALESARLQPPSERPAALDEVHARLVARMKSGLTDQERRAAAFLSAEIQFARGKATQAYEAYRKAERDGEKSPMADDAAFGAALSMEQNGRDEVAKKAWVEWEKKYPSSPLMAEARLARAWNALRRQSLPEANLVLDGCTKSHPWMLADPRMTLARATAAASKKKVA